MKALFLVLCFVATLVLCSSAIIDCPVNEQRIYNYESVIHSFGGTLKSEGKRKDDKNSTEGERSTITAQVSVTCVKSMPYKQHGNNKMFLMNFRVSNVHMNMTLDKASEWNQKYQKPAAATPNYDALFGDFTAFTMSAKGKIYKVFHAKNEQDWVTAMKKSIIAQLQVKYGDAERTEKDGVGKHVAHYKTKPQKDGSLVIKKKFTDRDVPKDASKSKRKQMRLTCKAKTLVDSQGHIQAVVKHEKVVFGTHHHGHKHPGFFSLRNVPYKNSTHFGTGHDMWLNADERTALVFVKTAPFSESITKHVRRNKNDNEVMSSHAEFELHDDIVASDLGIDEQVLRDMSRKTRKDLLHAQYDAQELIDTLTETPEDVMASTILSEFVQLDDDVVSTVHERFHNVSKKHGNEHGFLRAAQSLLAVANSTKAQEFLIKTLKSNDLVMHAILKAVHIHKPSDALLAVIEHYAKEAKNHNYTQLPKNGLALNAFLILASMASKVSAAKKEQIINEIESQMKNASSVAQVLFLVHALGNAGSASRLSPLRKIIFDKTTPLPVRIAAVEALRKRDDIEEDDQVNNLIHKIVSCRRCHTLVKLAAVKSQTSREEHLANGGSVNFFKKYLLNRRTPAVIRKAMVEYYDTHGTEEAGEILLMSNIDEFMSDEDTEQYNEFDDKVEAMTDAMFLKKIGNFFKRAGQAVGNAVKKVGEGVKKVVDKVGDALGGAVKKVKETIDKVKHAFAKATFENNQVCIPASKKPNDNMCLYDQDMVNFVSSQGDMSNHNLAAHFTFEKLIGANKLNLYIGALGVAGTNFNCAEPPSTFEFVVAGRFEAKTTVFSKKYSIISAHLTARQKDGQYYDKIYLRLLSNVIVDAGLLPQDKIKLCNEYNKALINKDFNNLPGLDMTIMIGPIPLTFGFQITANARLDAVAAYCFTDLTAKAGIQPGVSIGISGYAAIGIAIAKAGIRVEATLNYAVQPNVNAKGLQCKICANLDQVVRPMSVVVKGFADVNLWVVKFGGDIKLFEWSMPADTKPLFQRCLDIPRLFGIKKRGNMSMLSANEEINI